MFKQILDFFSGRSAERGLKYTDRLTQTPPAQAAAPTPQVNDQITDAVTAPSPQAESIKAAVEAKVAEAPAKRPAAKKTAAKKPRTKKQ